MPYINFDNIANGVVLCSKQNVICDRLVDTRNFIIHTKLPEQEHHYISVLVLDDAKPQNSDWEYIISEIKRKYGENLMVMLDANDGSPC